LADVDAANNAFPKKAVQSKFDQLKKDWGFIANVIKLLAFVGVARELLAKAHQQTSGTLL
jgi:hypothetical protein